VAKAEMLKAEMLKPEKAHQCDIKATFRQKHKAENRKQKWDRKPPNATPRLPQSPGTALRWERPVTRVAGLALTGGDPQMDTPNDATSLTSIEQDPDPDLLTYGDSDLPLWLRFGRRTNTVPVLGLCAGL
jgi:hypothetical protein